LRSLSSSALTHSCAAESQLACSSKNLALLPALRIFLSVSFCFCFYVCVIVGCGARVRRRLWRGKTTRTRSDSQKTTNLDAPKVAPAERRLHRRPL
jgi:hypothetical protein